MKRWEESIQIAAPASVVFAYVSDFPRHSEWGGHGLTVSGAGPVRPGATFLTVAKQFGTQRETSTIVDVKEPSMFSWKSVGGLGAARHWFSLQESGDSTTVTKGAEMTKPSFLAKIMGWKLSKDIPMGLRADLGKIKGTIEQR